MRYTSERGFRAGVCLALLGVLLILLGFGSAGLILVAVGCVLAVFS